MKSIFQVLYANFYLTFWMGSETASCSATNTLKSDKFYGHLVSTFIT